jgi:hypothetical protein
VKLRAFITTAAALAVVSLLAITPGPAAASHSWNGYHWARTADPFTLQVGDNVSGAWDSVLETTIGDWSTSTVLELSKVTGQANPRNCRPTSGRVEVCNSTYGNNGWLGLAQIWVSGKHITQGVTKLNDYYFNSPTYNTTAWRNLVSCQEVGHTLGLDHQDENFDNKNLGTCMDYTRDPSTNQHPNQHDYDELLIIYDPDKGGHLDSSTTVSSSLASGRANPDAAGNSEADWGRAIRNGPDGQPILFERDLGNNVTLFTWVTRVHQGGPGTQRP